MAGCIAFVIFSVARRFSAARPKARSASGSGTRTPKWSSTTATFETTTPSGKWRRLIFLVTGTSVPATLRSVVLFLPLFHRRLQRHRAIGRDFDHADDGQPA